jgi:hypothetical protein
MPRGAINISCGSYIAPILFARTASPIDPELAYNFANTDWKRKYGKTKIKSK